MSQRLSGVRVPSIAHGLTSSERWPSCPIKAPFVHHLAWVVHVGSDETRASKNACSMRAGSNRWVAGWSCATFVPSALCQGRTLHILCFKPALTMRQHSSTEQRRIRKCPPHWLYPEQRSSGLQGHTSAGLRGRSPRDAFTVTKRQRDSQSCRLGLGWIFTCNRLKSALLVVRDICSVPP